MPMYFLVMVKEIVVMHVVPVVVMCMMMVMVMVMVMVVIVDVGVDVQANPWVAKCVPCFAMRRVRPKVFGAQRRTV